MFCVLYSIYSGLLKESQNQALRAEKRASHAGIPAWDESPLGALGVRLEALLLASCRSEKSMLPTSIEIENGTKGNLCTLSVGKEEAFECILQNKGKGTLFRKFRGRTGL